MTRTALSQKTRFEIFKRDGFTCQYCGSSPPKVLLQVDHIIAVKSGGQNNTDNLITSCQQCNIGKGAIALSVIPQSLADKAKEVSEREAQLRGYAQIMNKKRKRIDSEMWDIANILEPGAAKNGFLKKDIQSIKVFITRLGFHEVLDAAEIAEAKKPYSVRGRWKYFCGVCWTKIKNAEGKE